MITIFPSSEDPATIDLSIIIVSWNVRDLLMSCLRSVDRETYGIRYEIFVVDNASDDQSAQMVRQQFPEVMLIANEVNRGFAAACNQALRRARGRMILLLNPDTLIFNHALEKLTQWMDERPKIGILGPQILNTDLSIQPSTRTFPSLGIQILVILKLHRAFSFFPSVARYFGLNQALSPHRVDQVMGACFLIRRQTFQSIGYFDERFWIWFEEVDYCRRAADAGWETWYTPIAQVMHQKGRSFEQVRAVTRQRHYNQSLFRYFQKHHTVVSTTILSLFFPVSLFLAL
ncbi:MAG: glycosyltransferase family 2 protein, partial [Patescibacteria group bacterium]